MKIGRLLVFMLLFTTTAVSASTSSREKQCSHLLDSADAKAERAEDRSNYTAALSEWAQAYGVCQQAGVSVDLRIRSVDRWAGVLREKKQPGKAETVYLEQLAKLESETGDTSPKLLPLYRGLVSVMSVEGKFEEALLYARRAVLIAERTYGAQSRQAVESSLFVGSLYEAQGKRSEAESYYRSAIKNAQAIPCDPKCEPLALGYQYLLNLIRDDPSRRKEFEEISLLQSELPQN